MKSFYEYRFIGKTQPEGASFYARSESYTFPYSDLPIIRTTLHPCFVFPYLSNYIARSPIYGEDPLMLLWDDIDIVLSIDHALNMFVYLSFLGNTLASHFPSRRIPSVILDRPRAEPQMEAIQSNTAALVESAPAPSGTRGAKRVRVQSPSASSESNQEKSLAKNQTLRLKRSKVSTKKQTSKSPAAVTRKPTSGRKRKISQTSSSTDDEAPTQRRRSPRFACS